MKCLVMGVVFLICLSGCRPVEEKLKITVIYNNAPGVEGLKSEWGFSCLIEGLEKPILFDTGGKGDVLLSNMEKLKIQPGAQEIVVLSHYHGDHTAGLQALCEKNPKLTVYLPRSFPDLFQRKLLNVIAVSEPKGILENVFSTGEMGEAIIEQGLVINRPDGAILITGCAHPGIVDMTKMAQKVVGNKVSLVMGGFHLMDKSKEEMQFIVEELKVLGVKRVAPSHCTGEQAMALFKTEFGLDYIEMGCGKVLEF